ATLVSTYERTLSYLRRGAFGTTIAGHLAGASFVRLDDSIYRFSYTSAQKGKTIYVKLPSFNIYGGGLQDLSTVTAYSVELDSDGKFYYPQPTAPGTVLLDQTTSGSFDFSTPDPASVKYLIIEMWGAGGAGGGVTAGSKGSTLGSGGGGGGYVKHKIVTPVFGTVLSGTVGNGGVFSGAGDDTTLPSLSLAANGGGAGGSALPGAGGSASGGSEDNTSGRNGGLTNTWDGGGAPNGGGDQTTAGMAGTTPGGGGAGSTTTAGTNGAPGRIKITSSDT
ncbi:MAG TPA: hypothetical protein VL133_12275, partial [Devosia sp.]|nr:hypothetical protein [Devosia sp.]